MAWWSLGTLFVPDNDAREVLTVIPAEAGIKLGNDEEE